MLANNGNGFETPENELNALGYQLMNSGDKECAVKIFRWNTELYPDSWNVWDSYGEGLAAIGKKQAAIEAYQKSIEFNPGNKWGVEIIKMLKSGKG